MPPARTPIWKVAGQWDFPSSRLSSAQGTAAFHTKETAQCAPAVAAAEAIRDVAETLARPARSLDPLQPRALRRAAERLHRDRYAPLISSSTGTLLRVACEYGQICSCASLASVVRSA